jgi:hypothetical protein
MREHKVTTTTPAIEEGEGRRCGKHVKKRARSKKRMKAPG